MFGYSSAGAKAGLLTAVAILYTVLVSLISFSLSGTPVFSAIIAGFGLYAGGTSLLLFSTPQI